MTDQLVDKQWITARTVVQSVRERRERFAGEREQAMKDVGDIVARDSPELPYGCVAARDERPFRAREMWGWFLLVVGIRDDQEAAGPVELAREEVHQLHRRGVAPVRVLQHQQERLPLAQASEKLCELPEQA